MPGGRRGALVAAIAVTVTLILAACGQSPSISLTLDAAIAELVRGGEVQVEVTLTRSGGSTADVALAVTGLPANVAASFSPATLSGGALTSTLTLSADAAAVDATSSLVVTGSGTGLAASTHLTLEVTSLTVTGRVVSMFEFAVEGAVVASQGDIDVTDMNGDFTLTGLSVPYDVSVWNSTDDWLHVFEGYTSDELVLAPLGTLTAPPVPTRSTVVQGNLSGGVMPVPTGQHVMVCVEGVDGAITGCDTVSPTENSYSIAAEWSGSVTRQVRLHALQIASTGGYATGYPGYATLAMTLTDATPVVANLDLGTALQTTTVDVEIDTPIAIAGTFAAAQLGPNLGVPVMLVNSAVTSHEVVMPVLTDVTYTFVATTGGQQIGWVADVTGPTATVVVPAAPVLVSPPDTTVGVTTNTVFTASNPTAGPMTFHWQITSGPMIGLTTMAGSHSIPDPTEYGMLFPTAAIGNWQVIGHSGATAESGSTGLTDLFNSLYMFVMGFTPGLDGTGSFAISDNWDFTTAP